MATDFSCATTGNPTCICRRKKCVRCCIAIANATAGQVVAIELTEPPSLYSQPMGRVTEVLGEIDDPGMEIEIAVRKYEVPHRFSSETVAQAAKLPEQIRASDRKHRVDLTDVPLVTIDGED